MRNNKNQRVTARKALRDGRTVWKDTRGTGRLRWGSIPHTPLKYYD